MRFVIIDGHSQIYRALYSRTASQIRDRDGRTIGGIVAFFKIFDSLIDVLKPDYLVVALDGPRKDLVRRELYPNYKASRKKAPDDFGWQVEQIIKALKRLKVPTLKIEGWEADDSIATLCDICATPHVEIVVVTRDKDIEQVLQPGVSIYEPIKGQWVTWKSAQASWGVRIDQIIEVQCLMGDRVDDIPGALGVGKVRATKLIHEYGTAREARRHRADLSPKLCKALGDFDIDLSYRLVRMKRNLKIRLNSSDLEWHGYSGRDARLYLRSLGIGRR